MQIRTLHLKNIRSYTDQIIKFSDGTTLLSGDIGSGKTTILLALEFALFGILRGKTSPAELLRHGSKEGTVSLSFSIDNHDITVIRGLKRSGKNIMQTPGKFILDGIEETLVATELKAKILSLLGYPESLLSRSTNLFRYTVYTPQEQVKAILHESVEERKDIIRKIFAIDKYRRVADNASHYTTDLRERIARLHGQTDDVKTLKQQYESQQKEYSLLVGQKPELEKKRDEEKKVREALEKELEKLRKDKEALEKKRHELKNFENQITHERNTLDMHKRQEKTLSETINKISIKEVSFDKERKEKIRHSLDRISEKKTEFDNQYGQIHAKESQAKELMEKIDRLTVCPMCKQDVTKDHKQDIDKEQQAIIDKVKAKKKKLDELYKQLQDKENARKEEFDKLLEAEKNYSLYVQQKKRLDHDKKQLADARNKIDEQNKKIAELQKHYEQKKTGFTQMKTIDDSKKKEDVDKARRQEREAELKLQDLKSKLDAAKRMLDTLSKAIKEKEEIAKRIEKLSSLRNWMQELFVPLVKTVEKRVMLKVYNEFNQYFIDWFSQLVEDDLLDVRLDEEFTPLLEQNGYDTGIENLSGGERTSVALSYRLALNKVLNEYFSSLKTTGLLILDEPTDGFSTQQLDTLREVLSQAGVKQLIIVSHEQKMESLADHLIRIEKDNHESKV
ncbi:MAG: AAA family ATPase, partial [Nanobdellota archaeon]